MKQNASTKRVKSLDEFVNFVLSIVSLQSVNTALNIKTIAKKYKEK